MFESRQPNVTVTLMTLTPFTSVQT